MATWKRVEKLGPVTKADWKTLLNGDRQIDPYLVWADLSEFAGFGGMKTINKYSRGQLPILVEMKRADLPVPVSSVSRPDAKSGAALCRECPVDFGLFEVQRGYVQEKEDAAGNPLGPRTDWRFLTGQVSPQCVEQLITCASEVVRFQLGVPRLSQMQLDAQPNRVPGGSAGAGDQPQVVIGVIDDGCPFAHEQFLTPDGCTRVVYFWDQDPGREAMVGSEDEVPPTRGPQCEASACEPVWHSPYLFRYGGELFGWELTKTLGEAAASASTYAPLHAYRTVNYVPLEPGPYRSATMPEAAESPLAMRHTLHGASVLSLAAGAQASPGRYRDDQGYVPWAHGQENYDTARAWPVVFVQLPTRTTIDTSGGSLGLHVLDAVRYIIRRAKSIPPTDPNKERGSFSMVRNPDPKEQPAAPGERGTFNKNLVVITLSYGAIAGPHDGTSMLEEALRDIVECREERVWVVLAAGNAHGARTHARMTLTCGAGAKAFTWFVGPDNPLESYLEVWLPDRLIGDAGPRARIEEGFVLEVQAPGSERGCSIRVGEAQVLHCDDLVGSPIASVIFARRVSQGCLGTMLLLAVRPTAARAMAPTENEEAARMRAPYGEWIVRVGLHAVASLRPAETAVVHAWAERNDRLFGTPRRQQSFVTSVDPVPSPTEFAPSAQEFCRRSPSAFTEEVPKPFQPELSMGSLSSAASTDDDFLKPDDDGHGKVVVVGGYRASDGEMASYSAGGPPRGSAEYDYTRLAGGACTGVSGDGKDAKGRPSRTGSNVDAVSDAGVALRGVRTATMVPGRGTRLSGTSAAAPTVSRLIAEAQFRRLEDVAFNPQRLGIDGRPGIKTEHEVIDPWRPTPTPHKDDRFRRGRWRVRRNLVP